MDRKHVAAAVIVQDGKLLATQRGHGDYRGFWEFPGGKLEPGETPEEAVVREIREELDCDITVTSFFLHVVHQYPEFLLDMDCFLCTVDPSAIRFLEHEDARWLTKEDLWSVKWLPADRDVLLKLEKEIL